MKDSNTGTGSEAGISGPEAPDASGQKIFSTVNIIIGILMSCCVVGIIPLVFGVLAAIYASESRKARTDDEAKSRIKTAFLLNIISSVSIVICLTVLIIFVLWVKSNIDFYSLFRDWFI